MASQAVETQLRRLFRRCVQCPNTTPACPVCPSGQTCSLLAQSCTQCASTTCVPNSISSDEAPPSSGSAASNSSGGGPNVGAIAGGVIGGVVFVALLTFLVWRFIIKPRRDQYEEDEDYPEEYQQEPKPGDENAENNNFTMQRDARASTHTVGSIASTVLTRASNVIQIAYIPGVTNRGGLESPDVLVPPVPPIPAMGSPANSPYASQRAESEAESHYFMPSDLRGSTYSAESDARSTHNNQRTSITPSLARASMASTVYRNNAIISPVSAQSAVRGKAAMVSVKSGSSSGENTPAVASTPPVPALDLARHGGKPLQVQIPSSAEKAGLSPQSSVRSTGTATYAKPIPLNITKMKGKQKSGSSTPDVSSISDAGTVKPTSPRLAQIASVAAARDNASTTSRPHSRAQQLSNQPSTFDDTSDDDEDEHARSRRSLIGRTRESDVTEIADTPTLNSNTSPDSPFADQTSSLLPTVSENEERRHSLLGINAVIEEATRRASRQPTHTGLGSDKRNQSPFDDSNATDDN